MRISGLSVAVCFAFLAITSVSASGLSDSWETCESRARDAGILKKFEYSTQIQNFNNFMATCVVSERQTRGEQTSNSWDDCDRKAADLGIKKKFEYKSQVEGYNEFMAVCTK